MTLGLALVMIVGFIGCGGGSGSSSGSGSASAPKVSEDDAKLAYILGMGTVFAASISAAFGQPMEGATLDDNNNLSLEKFDLAQLKGEDSPFEFPYTFVSGTAVSVDEVMEADLMFEGGPVESLKFSMTGEQLQSEDGFTATVTVNGQEMELHLTPEDLQGE